MNPGTSATRQPVELLGNAQLLNEEHLLQRLWRGCWTLVLQGSEAGPGLVHNPWGLAFTLLWKHSVLLPGTGNPAESSLFTLLILRPYFQKWYDLLWASALCFAGICARLHKKACKASVRMPQSALLSHRHALWVAQKPFGKHDPVVMSPMPEIHPPAHKQRPNLIHPLAGSYF